MTEEERLKEERKKIYDCMYLDWITLIKYIEIEHLNGNMSDALYSRLDDCLMSFKPRECDYD